MKDKDYIILGLLGLGAYFYVNNQIKSTQQIISNPWTIFNSLLPQGLKFW